MEEEETNPNLHDIHTIDPNLHVEVSDEKPPYKQEKSPPMNRKQRRAAAKHYLDRGDKTGEEILTMRKELAKMMLIDDTSTEEEQLQEYKNMLNQDNREGWEEV